MNYFINGESINTNIVPFGFNDRSEWNTLDQVL